VRILTVGNMYPPHHSGGYELVWRSAVSALRSEGHTVRVLTTDHRTASTEDDEPDVHRELRWYWREHEFPRRTLVACAAIERANLRTWERHVEELRPDVVAWWSMGGMSLSLLERARRSALPAVAFVHDDWLDYGQRADGWYRRFAGRPARAHLAEILSGIPTRVKLGAAARYEFVSETTRARAVAAGVTALDSSVAHSGIDNSLMSMAAERPWGWRLLYLGRVDPRKGIDTAVAALAHLPRQATLTVAGDGDRRERGRLEALVADLGLGDRVEFTGPCSRLAVQGRYAASDAVLFPVRWAEPWGLVPLEAMAVGRPVVATGRGGSGEYLRDGDNCLLFAAGDPQALAAALERLAGEDHLRARLREGGLRTAAEHTEDRFNRTVVAAVTSAARRAQATAGAGGSGSEQLATLD
jgi:glycosyltransferase involved in cell wall biosynthesis